MTGFDDPRWDDMSDEEWVATFLSRTLHYDHSEHAYVCVCPQYKAEKRCPHLYRLRRQAVVKADPRYL